MRLPTTCTAPVPISGLTRFAAIAANHFTGLPVTTFFDGYCHHFGIACTNALDAKLGRSASFCILHSAFCVPFFGPQLFVRDPARRGFHAISGLQDVGKLVDSVPYVAK